MFGLVSRVFANDPGDLGSIPGRVIPKTSKMVLETSLLNTRQYKVRIKGKVEQFWERSSAFPLYLGVVAIEKGAFWWSLYCLTDGGGIYWLVSTLPLFFFVSIFLSSFALCLLKLALTRVIIQLFY